MMATIDGNEMVREWESDGFRLELFDLNQRDQYGKWVLGYRFYDGGRMIFRGTDFHCSPMHAVDSDATVGSLLAFLSLRPGDTDAEYFDSYTPTQIEWRDDRAETLACVIFDALPES